MGKKLIFLVFVVIILVGCSINVFKFDSKKCFELSESDCQKQDVCQVAYWLCDPSTESCPHGEAGSCLPQ